MLLKGEKMNTKKGTLIIFSICLTFFSGLSAGFGEEAELEPSLFHKLQWRNIGPANMGGRTVDLDVVEKSPWIIYAAIGPSGVWKSENNGITWAPVFERENTVSVGDIAVCQIQPDIVWVGTGEATARNSVTIGDGVYKSRDEGKTWEHKGLAETRHISRIIPHPQDPDTVFVAAQGHLWGPNKERGVYKTTDGGLTWTQVLYVNPNTGIADLAIDPENGDILYAAAWDFQRFPFYFYSGGPGSGLYRSMDGGDTWERLVKDLPEGTLGRIGIAVSRSNPDVVYALIEHEDAGIWRSQDKGDSWERMCDNATYTQINFRPFYYSQIRIDPTDENVVYVFSGGSYVSRDGGKKFRLISAGTHPDHHALWIDPQNPLHLIDGNDGGIDISYDAGKTWRGIENMALAEVYQIGYDMRYPYHVYCGLQDNGVWGGPSATLDVVGITNPDWSTVGGGDGFYCQPLPSAPDIVYGNSQMNGLYRFDHKLKLSKNIKPLAPVNEPPFRFNWNSPIHISPHDPETLYTAGNFLFKSKDRGHSWSRISPDLTTNDPEKLKSSGGVITADNTGAEIHCTILSVAESYIIPGVIWCGTDDGNVQVTQDSGESWTNVASNIPGLPQNTWCSRIEASRFAAGTAFAVFDGHRSDDYNTYVYKTTDYGKTWTDISGNLPFGWVHVIRQDTRNPDLLYVGTEFSIFASWDSGESWIDLKNNLPTVAVRDVAVHPRDNDLIIGTHGRGVWILDDISVLQEFAPDVEDDAMFLFSIRPFTRFYAGSSQETFTRKAFTAQNPAYGINISVYLGEKPSEKPQISIKNTQAEIVYETSLPKREGLQQITWNLQYLPREENGQPLKGGGMLMVAPPLAAPGDYIVELALGGRTLSQKALIRPDPRFLWNPEEYADQVASQIQAIKLSRNLGLAVTATRGLRSRLDKMKKNLTAQPDIPEEVQAALKTFEDSFMPVEQEVLPQRFGYRLDVESALRGGNLAMRMAYLGMSLSTYPSAPTEVDMMQLQGLSEIVGAKVARLNALLQEDVSTLNAVLERNGLPVLQAPPAVQF
jgi:photosystem II stability/assembly factor-like uncharacterized protein